MISLQTPSGKLGGDLLQDPPSGASLGRKGTDGISCKQKSIGKPQKCGWKKNYQQTNREQPSPSLTLNRISVFWQYFHPKLEGKHEIATFCGELLFKSPTIWKCPFSEELHTESNPQPCQHSCQKLVPECFNYHLLANTGVWVSEHSVYHYQGTCSKRIFLISQMIKAVFFFQGYRFIFILQY